MAVARTENVGRLILTLTKNAIEVYVIINYKLVSLKLDYRKFPDTNGEKLSYCQGAWGTAAQIYA